MSTSLQWILIAAVTVAILYWAARALRKLGERERQQAAAPEIAAPAGVDGTVAPASAEDSEPDLQELSKALDAIYERSAHPQALESNPVFQRAAQALTDERLALDQVLHYALGANVALAAAATEALSRRSDSASVQRRIIDHLQYSNAWNIYFLLRYLVARAHPPVIGSVLVKAQEWWGQNAQMPHLISDFIDARVAKGDPPSFGSALDLERPQDLDGLARFLEKLISPAATALIDELQQWRRRRIDFALLSSIGQVWSAAQAPPEPIGTERTAPLLATALEAVQRQPARSLLIIGEAGTGKTALMRALAARLTAHGWTVFQASAAEIVAGQVYIGQLEERVHQVLSNTRSEKRIVWYVPQFHELLYAGQHSRSPIGVLDLVLPAIESGHVIVIGEIKPAALEKLVQQRPRVRFAFTRLNLPSASKAETLEIARGVVRREFEPVGLRMEETTLNEAYDLSQNYLHHDEPPGNLISLLHQARALVLKPSGPVALRREELLATLAQITGLPRSILDEHEGLDPHALQAFFASRVMGQPEAVSCLVDRVAMLKAGLTDPLRPIGVFLFAGPTGTGKTEVAKVLAEFLFGSADRMIRLDMSEFQEPSSIARLLGEPSGLSEADALVHRIRRQPFSVVLLDEFEKAHPRVWDLFLQVFDDARLTDAIGNVADFRHSIIILTSNLGAVEHRGGSLGFTSAGGVFSPSQVMRTLAATFRPEFVNRIDRVVVFRPLSKSVMRDILRKELRAVLQRRGFRSHEWAVEWEESAIDFLLQKGFTQDMGARPLRRAIDEYVLAPIAMTIVENRFPEGDQFLFVRAASDGLEVEFVDPDAPPSVPAPLNLPPTLTYPPLILSPTGRESERVFLEASCEALEQQLSAETWTGEKQQLLDAMRASGFWNDQGRFAVLARLENMDSIEAGLHAAHSLLKRLAGRSGRGSPPASIVSNLAQLLYLLEHALEDHAGRLSAEVFLAVEPLSAGSRHEAESRRWCETVARMYGEWARKRRLRVSLLSERAQPGVALLAIAGFGVQGILRREVGLHVLEVPDSAGGFDRLSVRVRLAPQPLTSRPVDQPEAQFAWGAIQGVDSTANTVVRRYREHPSPLVRDAVVGWRTGKLDQVLSGDFDLMAEEAD